MNIEHLISIVSTAETAGIDAAIGSLNLETASIEALQASCLQLSLASMQAERSQAGLVSGADAVASSVLGVGTVTTESTLAQATGWREVASQVIALATEAGGPLVGALTEAGAAGVRAAGMIAAGFANAARAAGGVALGAAGVAGSAALGVGRGAVGIGAAGLGAMASGARATASAVVGATTMIGLGFDLVALKSLGMAESYDHALNKVYALTGATKGQMDQYRTALLRIATETGKTPVDLADGLYFVASAGFRGAEGLNVLATSARAAAAGQTDTLTVADAVTSVLNSYKMGADKAGIATDIMTQAVTQGKMQYGDMAASVGQVVPLAAAAGVSWDQVAASMATMTRAGSNARVSATSLRAILQALVAPTTQTKKALDEMGLSSTQLRAYLGENGLAATLQMMWERSGKNLDVMRNLIPNIRGLTGVLSTTVNQSAAYAEILGTMADASGTTDEAFRRAQEDMGFQVTRLKATLSSLGIMIGNVLIPPTTALVEKITEVVGALFAWTEKNPELFSGIVKVLGAIGLMAGAFAGLRLVNTFIGPMLQMVGVASGFLGPFALIIGVVVAGVGAFFLFQKMVEANVAGFGRFAPAVQTIGGFFTILAHDVGAVAGMLGEFFRLIQSGVPLGQSIALAFDRLPLLFAILGVKAGEALGAIGSVVSDLLPRVLNGLGAMIPRILSWAAGAAGGLIQGGARLIGGFVEGLVRGTGSGGANNPIVSSLGRLITTIVQWAGQQVPVLARQLLTWAQSFVGWVARVGPLLLARIGQIVNVIYAWIGVNGPGIVARLASWGQAFLGWIGRVVPPLLAQLGSLIARVGTWIVAQIPGLLQTLVGWANTFISWLLPKIPGMLAVLGQFVGRILGWIPGALGQLAGALTRWGLEFIRWLLPQLPKMMDNLLAFVSGVVVWIITQGIPQLVGAVLQMAADFISGFFGPNGLGKFDFGKWIGDVLTTMGTWLNTLLQAGLNLGGQLAQGIINAVISIPGRVADELNKIPGVSIVGGILNFGANVVGTVVGGAVGVVTGGGRATGGPVSAGTMYRVNEGPDQTEYFRPSMSGYVLPMAPRGDLIAPVTRGYGGEGGGSGDFLLLSRQLSVIAQALGISNVHLARMATNEPLATTPMSARGVLSRQQFLTQGRIGR
jgi:TP901 family phage tail tape measure protein